MKYTFSIFDIIRIHFLNVLFNQNERKNRSRFISQIYFYFPKRNIQTIMSINYLSHAFGIIHLIRFICLIILLTFTEIKLSFCNSSLNEFLGFNHQSILFYYILTWISFSFDIYLFINRLFGVEKLQAKTSTFILYICLCLSYILASCFTLYAIIHYKSGHVITQHDFGDPNLQIIPITSDCNILRLIGTIFGFLISTLYFISLVLIYRLKY